MAVNLLILVAVNLLILVAVNQLILVAVNLLLHYGDNISLKDCYDQNLNEEYPIFRIYVSRKYSCT